MGKQWPDADGQARRETLLDAMRGPPPPFPPITLAYSDPALAAWSRASELENYTDENGLSCWRVKQKEPRD